MTKTLLDLGGVYKKHLDTTSHRFSAAVPADKRKSTVCQLQLLANTTLNVDRNVPVGARREVVVCMTCNAALCVRCWESFHTLYTLEGPNFIEFK